MIQIDYQVFDTLLAELFKGDRTYPVYIAETLRHILGKDVANSNDFYLIYPLYMSELEEHGLATERGTATIMDITPFGRQVHKAGGWQIYLKRQEDEAELIRGKEIADKRWSRWDVVGSFGGLVIGIVGFAFGVFQYSDNKDKDNQIKALQDSLSGFKKTYQKLKEVKKLDSIQQLVPKHSDDTLGSATSQKK